jgi:outer membrane protein
MKIRLLTLISAFFAMSLGAQSQKIGHIQMDELIQLMPETKAAQTEIETYAQKLDADFQEMQQELMSKVNVFRQNEAQMTKLNRDTKMQEIQSLQERIEAYQQSASTDLQQKQEQLLTPIIERAEKAIQEVCVEEGYAYILDSSKSKNVILAINSSNDILPLVKKKIGL